MKHNSRISLRGWLYLTLFVIFIVAGIVIKRVYHHAEWVPAFHLPAAVFLVLAGYDLTSSARRQYRLSVQKWEREKKASSATSSEDVSIIN